MGPEFHQTRYGKIFFEKQLPDLIRAIERNAKALEENNRLLKEPSQKCKLDKE